MGLLQATANSAFISTALQSSSSITITLYYNGDTTLDASKPPTLHLEGVSLLYLENLQAHPSLGSYRYVNLPRKNTNRKFYISVPTAGADRGGDNLRLPLATSEGVAEQYNTNEGTDVVTVYYGESWWSEREAPVYIAIIIAICDFITAMAYFQIGGEYWFYGIRRLKGFPYLWVLWFFILFTLSCGVVHTVQVFQHWYHSFTLLMAIKAWTGVISLLTALTCFWVLPQLRMLPLRRRDMCQEADRLASLIAETATSIQEKENIHMNILSTILPLPLAEKILEGKPIVPEEHEGVGVLYIKVKGLGKAIASDCDPIDVIEFLNKLYSLFDAILECYDCTKLDNITDIYIVATGLYPSVISEYATGFTDPLNTMFELALIMQEAVSRMKFTLQSSHKVSVDQGIEFGDITSGIIGKVRPKLCLFGNTINLASRMAVNSVASGVIQFNENTHQHFETFPPSAKDAYTIENRGEVFFKGSGIHTVYILEKKRGLDMGIIRTLKSEINAKSNRHGIFRTGIFDDMASLTSLSNSQSQITSPAFSQVSSKRSKLAEKYNRITQDSGYYRASLQLMRMNEEPNPQDKEKERLYPPDDPEAPRGSRVHHRASDFTGAPHLSQKAMVGMARPSQHNQIIQDSVDKLIETNLDEVSSPPSTSRKGRKSSSPSSSRVGKSPSMHSLPENSVLQENYTSARGSIFNNKVAPEG
eukprot:Nk52_evm26s2531 gene=Nk52_evmTU26s2531